jgi:hypothetical protein
MTMQDWGAVSEVIGAVAVIITLIYLAVQIKQNTSQIRNEGHARITESYNDIISQLLADNDLFTLVIRGCQDWEQLTAFEQSRFHLLFHEHLMHLRMAYQLKSKDAIDEDVYDTIEDLHINVMANPGALVWWNMVGKSLVQDDLEKMIDEKLKERAGTGQVTTEAWDFYNPKNWAD